MSSFEVKSWMKFMKSPRMVLIGIAVGVVCGLYSPRATAHLLPISVLFFALLKMCALPIVVTAVILSFARLWERPGASQSLVRIGLIFLGGVVPTALAGVLTGLLLGEYLCSDAQAFAAISDILGRASHQHNPGVGGPGIIAMIVDMVPRNIFHALSEGQILGTLIFVVMLGLAISHNVGEEKHVLIAAIEGLNEAFYRMVDWVIVLLPFALCAITAQTVAGFGNGAFNVLGKLIGVTAGGCFAIFAVQLQVVRWCLRESWGDLYRRLREPLLVALTSSSSLASLPSMEVALAENSDIPKWLLDLMLPLGITFHQQATTFFFAMVGAVVARLYGIAIGPTEVVVIVFGSYLQSVAAAGLPAAASLGFLASVFRPLGLPVETLEVVFVAIIPFLDPIETMVNVMGQVVAVAVAHRLAAWRGSPEPETEPMPDEILNLR